MRCAISSCVIGNVLRLPSDLALAEIATITVVPAFRRTNGKNEIVNVAICRLDNPAQPLCRVQPHFIVGLQQFQKVLPVDKVYLAGSGSLGGRFIIRAGNRGAQAQSLAGPAVLRMRILPSLEVVERFTFPEHRMNMPRAA